MTGVHETPSFPIVAPTFAEHALRDDHHAPRAAGGQARGKGGGVVVQTARP